MPELPEVETVKRGLETLLVGHTIQAVNFDWPKSFPNSDADIAAFLVGSKVITIRRRAKVLIIDLSSSYSLVIHLKMTGQLVFVKAPNDKSQITNNGQGSKIQRTKQPILGRHSRDLSSEALAKAEDGNPVLNGGRSEIAGLEIGARDLDIAESETRFGAGHPTDSLVGELPDKSTRVTFDLDKDARLFFNDQRKFGWVKLLPTVNIMTMEFMKKVGPEPLEDSFTPEIFIQRLQRRKNTTIKAAILDQTVLAGIGNIYADEGLWGAEIHPATRVKDVPKSKLKKLFTELRYVLELSIEKGGSTDKNYVNAEGKRGSYIDFARVFRKEGTPCPRHPDTLIEKTRVAGRGTHLCPECQRTTVT